MATHLSFDIPRPNLAAWQAAYHAAVTETEPARILKQVHAAAQEISKRFQAIFDSPAHGSEASAMFEALGTLRFLEFDAQKRLTKQQ